MAAKKIASTENVLTTPERVKSGVPGLDELLDGGIPKGSLVVVSGDPGSGKTVLCMQYLYYGAKYHNEPGVYISLEEEVDELVNMASYFGWNLREQMDKGMLEIENIELYDFDKLRNTIETLTEKLGAKRVIIDPGVIFRLYFEKELDARKRILSLGRMLKRLNVTSIITNEISLDNSSSLFGLEEYVADGVILMYHTKLQEKFIRGTGILKMRNTKISENLHPVRIDREGVHILAGQQLFEDVK
ncbi:MAG: ATPase domain-containing protein [Candidatus Diapherotrites archaeon]|nr:ATPase domain-containing protein [Candidatus Diapherotrites archaeon]